jgi:hypothetical protein
MGYLVPDSGAGRKTVIRGEHGNVKINILCLLSSTPLEGTGHETILMYFPKTLDEEISTSHSGITEGKLCYRMCSIFGSLDLWKSPK